MTSFSSPRASSGATSSRSQVIHLVLRCFVSSSSIRGHRRSVDEYGFRRVLVLANRSRLATSDAHVRRAVFTAWHSTVREDTITVRATAGWIGVTSANLQVSEVHQSRPRHQRQRIRRPPRTCRLWHRSLPPNNLTLALDGSGSTEPDGVIAAYAWNLGDTPTASRVTPSHTYAAASDYTVTESCGSYGDRVDYGHRVGHGSGAPVCGCHWLLREVNSWRGGRCIGRRSRSGATAKTRSS